jgi:hypothetical protein
VALGLYLLSLREEKTFSCRLNVSEDFFIVVPCILIILKLFSPTNAHFIEHTKMLKFTIKTSMHSLLHVSVHLDHLQGAYDDPC